MCPGKEICLQSIYSHDQELLEYSIENYNDNTEENQIVSDAMQNFENEKEEKDNENYYNVLNIENLIHGFSSYNYQIITTCLGKFVFMSQNIEQFDQHFKCDRTFLFFIKFDVEILKFVYSQIKNANSAFIWIA